MNQNLQDLIANTPYQDLLPFLEASGIRVKDLGGGLFNLNYYQTTRRWERWACECRGAVIASHEGQWTIVKYALPRIPEDCPAPGDRRPKIDLPFDPKTVEVFELVMKESELPEGSYLTGKIDGSLLTVTCFPFASDLGKRMVPTHPGPDKDLHDLALRLGLSFYPRISTIKSFEIDDPKCIKYIMSALIISSGVVDPIPDSMDDQVGEIFLRRLSVLMGEHTTDFYFEAVCPNLSDLWGNHHPELHVSYPRTSGLYLLGKSERFEGFSHVWSPSFTQEIAASGFDQPPYWIVRSGAQVREIVTALHEEITNGSKGHFLQRHPPQHPVIEYYHYEGFVLVTPSSSIKIKTPSYQLVSGRTVSDLGEAYRLGETFTGSILPKTAGVYGFFRGLRSNLDSLWNDYGQMGLVQGAEIDPEKEYFLLSALDPFLVYHLRTSVENPVSFLLKNSRFFLEESLEFFMPDYPGLRHFLRNASKRDTFLQLLLARSEGRLPEEPSTPTQDFYLELMRAHSKQTSKKIVPKIWNYYEAEILILVSSSAELERDVDLAALRSRVKSLDREALLLSASQTHFMGRYIVEPGDVVYHLAWVDRGIFKGDPDVHRRHYNHWSGSPNPLPEPSKISHHEFIRREIQSLYDSLDHSLAKYCISPRRQLAYLCSTGYWGNVGSWYRADALLPVSEETWNGLTWKSVFVDVEGTQAKVDPEIWETFITNPSEEVCLEIFRKSINHARFLVPKENLELHVVICLEGVDPKSDKVGEKYQPTPEDLAADCIGIFYLYTVSNQRRYYSRFAMI